MLISTGAAADSVSGGDAFTVRDQNPLLAGLGLPTAMPSRVADGWTTGVDVHWGSTALMQERGSEALLVDAETREARFTLQGTLSERFSWQVQLPYRYTGSGNLDSFIDGWHDFFGLSEGARSTLPSDQIDIAYTRSGVRELDIRSSASGLADVQAALGYRVHSSNETALMTWLTVKLPTGDADKLTGSGATDVSLLLAGQHRINERWSVFGQAAGTYLGEGNLLPDQQRSVVWSGMAGVSVLAWRGLSFKAQVDAHTAAFDSDLDFFSEAVVLTVGGDYRFASGWRLDLGVSEDIAVEHSPDVVFILGLKQGW
ncbi:DUF3187 family protein [Steroidobacter sp.]|uniref:DUF3187 family protein n=1 Tax=Steroidobacter sp. TaxID=1978227 RepID=UPI001A4E5E41|nr:DUF3187 family protein [Steroidobacter sp.]MBL8266156.1 DUF3187 family protein [Steroidobacter sp.]